MVGSFHSYTFQRHMRDNLCGRLRPGKAALQIRLRKKLNLLPGSGRESESLREPAGNRCELMRVEERKITCTCVRKTV